MTLIDEFDLPEICFRAQQSSAAWVQFDIGLVRAAGDARASSRQLFDVIVPWWEQQQRLGHVSNWFFMRKPPDVRLRFLVAPAAAPALAAFANDLADVVAAGAIASCEPGVYAPEETRFGGPSAMSLVHGLFTLDTLLWYRLDQCERLGERLVPVEDWLTAVFQDLFTVVCGEDSANAWRRLASHVLIDPAVPVPAAKMMLPDLAQLSRSKTASPAEQRLAALARFGNARFGSALTGLAANLPPACPPAEVAATAAFFMLNRHGFPGERSRPLVSRVLADLATVPRT